LRSEVARKCDLEPLKHCGHQLTTRFDLVHTRCRFGSRRLVRRENGGAQLHCCAGQQAKLSPD
jgi:hypothetical protein